MSNIPTAFNIVAGETQLCKDYPVDDLIHKLKKFFKDPEKTSYSGTFGFGYSAVDHKEGFRILTGKRMKGKLEHNYLSLKCSVISLIILRICAHLDAWWMLL